MPNGWKKNSKYFDPCMTHKEYTEAKSNFRKWKKRNNIKDNYAPFSATQISNKVWVPPTDYLNGYSKDVAEWGVEYHPLSKEDHKVWAFYLKSWKRKMSNGTLRHKGCKPDCRICNPRGHGAIFDGERKSISKKAYIDINLDVIKPKFIPSGITNECCICYDRKPEHITVQLHCAKSQKNKYFVCTKCRDNINTSEFNSCPRCRKHPI